MLDDMSKDLVVREIGLKVVEDDAGFAFTGVHESTIDALAEIALKTKTDIVNTIYYCYRDTDKETVDTKIVDKDLNTANKKFSLQLNDHYFAVTYTISLQGVTDFVRKELYRVEKPRFYLSEDKKGLYTCNEDLQKQIEMTAHYIFRKIRFYLENLNIKHIFQEDDKWHEFCENMVYDIHVRTFGNLMLNRWSKYDDYIRYDFWKNILNDDQSVFLTYKQCDENTLGIRLYLDTNHLIKEIRNGKEELSKYDEYGLNYTTVCSKGYYKRYRDMTDDELREKINDCINFQGHTVRLNPSIELRRAEMMRLIHILDNYS